MSSLEIKSWSDFNSTTILFKNNKFWCEVLILLFWQRSPSGKHKFPLLLSSRPQSSGYSWSLPVHWTKIENFNSELQVNLVFLLIYIRKLGEKEDQSSKQSFSLLICTLRSDFEGGRKVVLQTGWLETRKKSEFPEPQFLYQEERCQKITKSAISVV